MSFPTLVIPRFYDFLNVRKLGFGRVRGILTSTNSSVGVKQTYVFLVKSLFQFYPIKSIDTTSSALVSVFRKVVRLYWQKNILMQCL